MSSATYLLLGLAALAILVIYELVSRRKSGQDYSLEEAAVLFVKAAEMLLPGQTGEAKLKWVIQQLDALGFHQVDEDLIRAVIEAAVYSVKKAGIR